jgi:hypothetical protein
MVTDTKTARGSTPSTTCPRCGAIIFSPLRMNKCPNCGHMTNPSVFGKDRCDCHYCAMSDSAIESADFIEVDQNQINHLAGLTQICPICLHKLHFRELPGLNEEHFHCKNCGTEWSPEALIQALSYDELSGSEFGESDC